MLLMHPNFSSHQKRQNVGPLDYSGDLLVSPAELNAADVLLLNHLAAQRLLSQS